MNAPSRNFSRRWLITPARAEDLPRTSTCSRESDQRRVCHEHTMWVTRMTHPAPAVTSPSQPVIRISGWARTLSSPSGIAIGDVDPGVNQAGVATRHPDFRSDRQTSPRRSRISRKRQASPFLLISPAFFLMRLPFTAQAAGGAWSLNAAAFRASGPTAPAIRGARGGVLPRGHAALQCADRYLRECAEACLFLE